MTYEEARAYLTEEQLHSLELLPLEDRRYELENRLSGCWHANLLRRAEAYCALRRRWYPGVNDARGVYLAAFPAAGQ